MLLSTHPWLLDLVLGHQFTKAAVRVPSIEVHRKKAELGAVALGKQQC